MPLVVDARMVKWVVEEEGRDLARSILLQGEPLIAPEFLLIEAANVLSIKVARGQIVAEGAEAGLEAIQSAFQEFVPDARLADAALRVSLELAHPVYDCVYLACMSTADADFVTADRRLLNKLKQTGNGPRVHALAS